MSIPTLTLTPTPTPTPQLLLQGYFCDLLSENWSQNTIHRRTYSLNLFLKWASERGAEQVTAFTPELLQAYRRYLYEHRNRRTDKPLRFATQASYLAAVKHWCAGCWNMTGSALTHP